MQIIIYLLCLFPAMALNESERVPENITLEKFYLGHDAEITMAYDNKSKPPAVVAKMKVNNQEFTLQGTTYQPRCPCSDVVVLYYGEGTIEILIENYPPPPKKVWEQRSSPRGPVVARGEWAPQK